MLEHIGRYSPSLRFRFVAGVALAYAPLGVVAPTAAPYSAGILYALAVHAVSTALLARRIPAPWQRPLMAHAAAAAVAGTALALLVDTAVRALQQVAIPDTGMRFTIAECYDCGSPWDAPLNVAAAAAVLATLAAALALPVGAVARSVVRHPSPARFGEG